MKLDKMKKAVVNNPLARVLAADNDMLQHICVIRHMEDERARPGVLGSESIPKKELEERKQIHEREDGKSGVEEVDDEEDIGGLMGKTPGELRNIRAGIIDALEAMGVDLDAAVVDVKNDETAEINFLTPAGRETTVKIESRNIQEQKSVYMLTPLTDEARKWIDDNINPESWQWLGGGLGVEHSYIADIVDGMEEEGLKHGKDFKVESKDITEQRSTWHVIPLTNKAQKWIDKNLSPESGQRVADGFEVDDRKLDGVANQMAQAGLVHSIDFKVESKQV